MGGLKEKFIADKDLEKRGRALLEDVPGLTKGLRERFSQRGVPDFTGLAKFLQRREGWKRHRIP